MAQQTKAKKKPTKKDVGNEKVTVKSVNKKSTGKSSVESLHLKQSMKTAAKESIKKLSDVKVPVKNKQPKKVAKPVKEKFVDKVTTNKDGESIVITKGGRVWTRKENIKFFGIELNRAHSSVSRLLLITETASTSKALEEQKNAKIVIALLNKAKDLFNETFA